MLVACFQCLGRQFHAAAQVPQLGCRWDEGCGLKMLMKSDVRGITPMMHIAG